MTRALLFAALLFAGCAKSPEMPLCEESIWVLSAAGQQGHVCAAGARIRVLEENSTCMVVICECKQEVKP